MAKKKKFKIKKVDWYGFKHKVVCEKFEGDLEFINEFCVKGEYDPVAVYKSANPNKAKGHKKYMFLQMEPLNPAIMELPKESRPQRRLWVRGMSAREMQKERYQDAIFCLACNTVLYSINRHHCHTCGCENDTMVDGGKDYLRAGGKDLSKMISVRLDLLTDTIKEYKS